MKLRRKTLKSIRKIFRRKSSAHSLASFVESQLFHDVPFDDSSRNGKQEDFSSLDSDSVEYRMHDVASTSTVIEPEHVVQDTTTTMQTEETVTPIEENFNIHEVSPHVDTEETSHSSSLSPRRISLDENQLDAWENETAKLSKKTESIVDLLSSTISPKSVCNPTQIHSGDDHSCISKNTSKFQIGDEVMVVKNPHPKHGMRGIVERKTPCFVIFKENVSESRIRIKPHFLSRLTADASVGGKYHDVSFEETTFQAESQTSSDSCSTLCSASYHSRSGFVKNQSCIVHSSAPLFQVGDEVVVQNHHHKHKMKCGIIEKSTPCFVYFREYTTKQRIKIKPKFLSCVSETSTRVRDEPLYDVTNTLSQRDVIDYSHEKGAIEKSIVPVTSLWDVPQSSVESRPCFGNHFIEKVHVSSSVLEENCLLKLLWKGRVTTIIFNIDRNDNSIGIPIHDPPTCLPGSWTLYYADVVCKQPRGSKSYMLYGGNQKHIEAVYVQTDGPNGMEPVDLRKREESIADFSVLSPNKVWDRRSLALTPAMKIKGEYAIKTVSPHDIVMIKDAGTTGCGFIDEGYLEKLLGSNKDARRAIAIQVRIFVPSKGIFKGMLMRKKNVANGRIELNRSLQKVMPSNMSEIFDNGYIIVKQRFPSTNNLQMSRVIDGTPVTKTFTKGLEKGTINKISPMIKRVWIGMGVPEDTVKQYSEASKKAKNLRHSWVVGVADPTNELPHNTVFVTGLSNKNLDVEKIFITRSPCLEVEDGRIIEIVRSKPHGMSSDIWNWLESLHFGALIFGNPRSGQKPLPEVIAAGDLDGDLYFICWDTILFSKIIPAPITDQELSAMATAPKKTANERRHDPQWFEHAQGHISNIQSIVDVNELTGRLWKQSEKFADANREGLFIKHPDAVSFARACKQCLDLKKHGGSVLLPKHLHEELPEKFHKYLQAESAK